jgi:hypothetical protein
MIRYALWFFWTATKGHRLRPWRSPYLRWRVETFSGIPAGEVTYKTFWNFLWNERQDIRRFLEWGAEMKSLEKRLRRQAR